MCSIFYSKYRRKYSWLWTINCHFNPLAPGRSVISKHIIQNKVLSTCCGIMMTSSNGNIFRVTGPLCGEFTGPGEFPTQRPVTRNFDVFFDLRLIQVIAWCHQAIRHSWATVDPDLYHLLALLGHNWLTHWGRATHICVGKLTIIGSDNGLSPGRRQSIIWTIAGILIIGPLGTNFSEILIGIQTFSFKKMHLKMSSAKWRPFVSASIG